MKPILYTLLITISCIYTNASVAGGWTVLQNVIASDISLTQEIGANQVQALNLINRVTLSSNTSSQQIIADSLNLQQLGGTNNLQAGNAVLIVSTTATQKLEQIATIDNITLSQTDTSNGKQVVNYVGD